MKRIVVAALILAGWLGASVLPGRAAGDPYAIFDRARNVWEQQRYPDYLTYVVTVRVVERGVEKFRHYHLAYDVRTAKIHVDPVSDEERVAPPDPNGVQFHLLPRRQGKVLFDKKIGNPGEAVDYLGVPMISPTYSFGMTQDAIAGDPSASTLVQEIRKEYNDPTPPAVQKEIVDNGKIKTIASITAFKRSYTIVLDGVENVDGHACYHLSLTPAERTPLFRLREAWVDTATYETRKLVTDGNFVGSPVPWEITFQDLNGALYIASETAMKPVGVGDHRYEQASVSFDQIAQSDRPATTSTWFVTKENVMTEPGDGGP